MLYSNFPQKKSLSYLKKRLFTYAKIFNDYLHDYIRFTKFSASISSETQQNQIASIIKDYHAIEKGLALPQPKIGFGQDKILKLIDKLELYKKQYGNDIFTEISLSTLKEYLEFDKENNQQANPVIALIENLLNDDDDDSPRKLGGTLTVTKKELDDSINIDFSKFFRSRHSVRDFSQVPVNRDTLYRVIENALYTPSVCNRQAWKVFLVDDSNPTLKQQLLNIQNGNTGFGSTIHTLLVVTGKLGSFFEYERNQVYIDGGMFAMSIILGLHAEGLGACCLNTSFTASRERLFKKIMNTDEDIVPIMFIGVGNLKESFKVAASHRKPLLQVLEVC